MRKEKTSPQIIDSQSPFMKVVESSTNQSKLEFEIELHVKSIRALIKKLRPSDRQRYYDGLLSHILSQPIEYPKVKNSGDNSFDYCNLTMKELSLVKELSTKIHELYVMSDDNGLA
jgi:hypothetical protein